MMLDNILLSLSKRLNDCGSGLLTTQISSRCLQPTVLCSNTEESRFQERRGSRGDMTRVVHPFSPHAIEWSGVTKLEKVSELS